MWGHLIGNGMAALLVIRRKGFDEKEFNRLIFELLLTPLAPLYFAYICYKCIVIIREYRKSKTVEKSQEQTAEEKTSETYE